MAYYRLGKNDKLFLYLGLIISESLGIFKTKIKLKLLFFCNGSIPIIYISTQSHCDLILKRYGTEPENFKHFNVYKF